MNDTVGVAVWVLLSLVGAIPESQSLPLGKRLQRELRRACGSAITLIER